jgi:hypothetical protein
MADSGGVRSGTRQIDNIALEGVVVPEPSTYAMFVIGGLAFLVYRRRRSAQHA